MKKKIVFIPLIIILVVAYGVYWAFFDMNRLPKGDYQTRADSPDGTYTVKAYVSNGGATTDYAVRGELIFNKENRRAKNIYWNYHEEYAQIEWKDEDTVVINGHELTVPQDTYDFRRD
ncbi:MULTISPECIES: DUF5412 domain-containing protein [unclassified Bacillus (in: firmicutes)]|uniref:DUF5412 domain-containing protein n=1 Tax=unclassified Bacillus (in: firmicutes) TaxID=185979 RepID=UPI0020C850D8|nr:MULTISPECIES: DUF5412 domain-containing protein [unclassified Bacillus (in: firmicutes)]